ncbi:hypothetical protein PVK06_034844 [Gossypium arboreum]|uniref:RNase H type-1 domain-containing protein n=1 Tax=Gossypium arboreum TaxID=29729 RepID=A0ABR0NFA0_GOSAR|nr:hypothetical protein PVK06_034844 [Gossypium arboreum]
MWETTSGDLLQKLDYLRKGLDKWAVQICLSRKQKKELLTSKLFDFMEIERSDNNLAELIDTKLQLNFEIDKDERYWKQRARSAFVMRLALREGHLKGVKENKKVLLRNSGGIKVMVKWAFIGVLGMIYVLQKKKGGLGFRNLDQFNIALLAKQVNNVAFFCCAAWIIWSSRNQFVHERKTTAGRDLSKRVQSYIAKIDGSEEKPPTLGDNRRQRQITRNVKATIYFDAAFDSKYSRSTSALVVRGEMDEFLASKIVLHSAIPSPIMAEAYARLQAVKLGISLGFQSIVIIGDSKTVIKKYNSTATDKSVLRAVIRDIQRKKQFFLESNFHFVNRSENGQAHELATKALRKGEEKYLEEAAFTCLQCRREERWLRNLN